MFWRRKKVVEWHPILQEEAVAYPTGSCVRTTHGIYFVKDGKKFRIFSDKVLESWKFNSVAACKPTVLDGYKNAGVLGFRDGTLIEDISTRQLYLISDSKKRHIVSPEAFDKYGYNRANVVEVSQEEADLHTTGEVLK